MTSIIFSGKCSVALLHKAEQDVVRGPGRDQDRVILPVRGPPGPDQARGGDQGERGALGARVEPGQ